jgi:cation-transporting ATPase 13A1
LHYAREGARVLCLGYKELGVLSHQELRDITRSDVESELKFVGFVIISCPLKPDTKSVIKEISSSSHHITMITGDNPLTACHVASQLKLIDKKNAFVLSKPTLNDDGQQTTTEWCWQSIIDENVQQPLEFVLSKPVYSKLSKLEEAVKTKSGNSFCLTGEVLITEREREGAS